MATLKPLITGKYSKKRKGNNNLLKTKRILKPKYKLGGRPVFAFSLTRGGDPLFFPPSVTSSMVLRQLEQGTQLTRFGDGSNAIYEQQQLLLHVCKAFFKTVSFCVT